MPEVLKCSARAMRWRPILLKHNNVHINASLPSQCNSKTFRDITSMYRSALPVTRSPSLSSKKYNLKIPPLPIAYHTVTFYWLNGCWVCLWGCWDGQNLMFYLLTCPLRWKWTSSLNRIKPRSLGLFSILPLLSFLFASVCFWRIRTLYGNNFK